MARTHAHRHLSALDNADDVDDVKFQFTLVLAGVLALAVALVLFFPDRESTESWRPEATVAVLGP